MPSHKPVSITVPNCPEVDDGSYTYHIAQCIQPDALEAFLNAMMDKGTLGDEWKDWHYVMEHIFDLPEWKEMCGHTYAGKMIDLVMKKSKEVEESFPEPNASNPEPTDDNDMTRQTTVQDDMYDRWILQIHRLPPRKRKKWKDYIYDRQHRKSEVRWRYNKIQENHPDAGWVDVLPMSRFIEGCRPTTFRGVLQLTIHRMKQEENMKYVPEVLDMASDYLENRVSEILSEEDN